MSEQTQEVAPAVEAQGVTLTPESAEFARDIVEAAARTLFQPALAQGGAKAIDAVVTDLTRLAKLRDELAAIPPSPEA
jgi:hypothetical protein